MHNHNHTHLDNLVILCQLIIVLPHQQYNESGFAPKERVKEGEEGGREKEKELRKGEATINKQPLQR